MKNKLEIVLFIISFFMIDATVSYVKKDSLEENNNIDTEIKAVYISYLEYLNGNNSQVKIDKMIDNINEDHFNTILLHVSPFSDSVYHSKIFPFSHTLTGFEGKYPGFDFLEYFIKKSHQKNIKVYAWINPYRISFDNYVNISKDNPAYNLLNTSSVYVDNKGIYYNPASEIVKNLIIKQVEEIIDNYNVDGIHFDDSFYIQGLLQLFLYPQGVEYVFCSIRHPERNILVHQEPKKASAYKMLLQFQFLHHKPYGT